MPPYAPPTNRPGERQLALTRASREIFQRRLGDVVRTCVAHSPAAAAAFERELGEAHDELLSTHSDDDFGQASELTASRLTLMGDDDLELDIRMRSLGGHLREAAGRALSRCQSRYLTLLGWSTINEGDEPLGPEVICLGLWALCREAARGLEEALTLLDRIEQRLLRELPLIYSEIDAFLASQGIESAPTQRRQQADAGTATAQPPPSTASHGQSSSSALQDAVRQQTAGTPPASSAPLAGDGSPQAGTPTLDTAALVMLNHLLARLTALEARTLATDTQATNAASTSAPRSQDLDLPPGRPEAIAIDTMALIFEAMFESDELPDAIRAALGSLQIPLLRVAIVDPALLSSEAHPARLLLNRIGHAALGLPRSTPSEHPLCQRLCRLAATARTALGRQPVDLDAPLADLAAVIDDRERTIRLAAEPYVQMVRTHESQRYANQLATTWLRTSLARTRSAEIAAFLETHWLQVMISAGAGEGPHGERWQQHSRTADDLIWSVLPKQGPDERKRLAGMASSLLKRIAEGLDEIGLTAAERKPFLDRLFDLQTAALRNQPAAAAAVPDAPPAGRSANRRSDGTGDGARLLESDGRQIRYLGSPAGERTVQTAAATGWQVGEWLRFSLPDAGPLCGLCCWQDPAGATVLLFNPDWRWAVAAHRSLVDRQVATGEARIVSRIGLFDAAAERALRRLSGG